MGCLCGFQAEAEVAWAAGACGGVVLSGSGQSRQGMKATPGIFVNMVYRAWRWARGAVAGEHTRTGGGGD
mgnify:FL=1